MTGAVVGLARRLLWNGTEEPHMRASIHVTVLVIGVAAGGCATAPPIVHLYPTSPTVVWSSGRAAVTREEAGVRVAVAFDHQDGPNLGLRVEVSNQTAGQLDVDPQSFTFTTCQAAALSSCTPTRRVIDPETTLAALEVRQARERAAAANSQAMLGTLVILSAVSDVASVASGHPSATTGVGTAAAAGLAQGDAAQRDSTLASIAVQQRIWSDEALRRNTLFPGQGTAGQVYAPIDLDAQMVWIHVKVGPHVFSIPFRQVVTRLSPYGEQPNETLSRAIAEAQARAVTAHFSTARIVGSSPSSDVTVLALQVAKARARSAGVTAR